jgi:hypothetical protein
VMYVYLDRFRLWAKSHVQRFSNPLADPRPRGPGKVRGAEQGAG